MGGLTNAGVSDTFLSGVSYPPSFVCPSAKLPSNLFQIGQPETKTKKERTVSGKKNTKIQKPALSEWHSVGEK